MLTSTYGFSGLGVSDLTAAKDFYGTKLGLPVEEDMGGLRLTLPGGAMLFVYQSPSFSPAGYTVLDFQVADIEQAVRELADAGIALERYEGMQFDELGISRGKAANCGPDIAWFRDPSGNILAVLEP